MTSISWTDETWNPTDGCECVSPGCANCYAMRFAGRFSKPGERYHGLVTIAKNKRAVWSGEGRFSLEKLLKPLHWKKPRRIFVNSMSDLFFERFTDEEIDQVFAVMSLCPQHTFQVLTKRASRMRSYFEAPHRWACIEVAARSIYKDTTGERFPNGKVLIGPMPHVWLGVSVENNDAMLVRIFDLIYTPAAVRYLSCEPLIGEVNPGPAAFDRLHWVIAGCESGPGKRPCDVAWLRLLRDRCAAAGVPFFLKQAIPVEGAYTLPEHGTPSINGKFMGAVPIIGVGPGSREKGRGLVELPYLDGEQHAAFPSAAR